MRRVVCDGRWCAEVAVEKADSAQGKDGGIESALLHREAWDELRSIRDELSNVWRFNNESTVRYAYSITEARGSAISLIPKYQYDRLHDGASSLAMFSRNV